METPHLRKAKLTKKQYLNEKTLLCEFALVEPPQMQSSAGQFVSLNVGENAYRPYSICSNPKNTQKFELIATVAHNGVGSSFLKSVQINQEVTLIGPSGRFKLPKNLFSELVFIATGTGIAPFISMFYDLFGRNYTRKINLYFGLRNENELFFIDILEKFKQEFKNFSYKLCFSQPSLDWKEPKGRVTNLLDIKNFGNKQFFVCGNPYMIEDIIRILKSAGVSDSCIFYEKFTVKGM